MSTPFSIYPKEFIVQTGVAGTARSPLTALPEALVGSHFWDLAAATFWIDKAARISVQIAGISPPLSGGDALSVCSEAATTALEAILYRGRAPALDEWLMLAGSARVSAPSHMLPGILQQIAKSDATWELPDARALWVSAQHPEWKRLFVQKRTDIQKTPDIRAPEDPREALLWAIRMLTDARPSDIQAIWSTLAYHTNPNAVHTWDAARDLPEATALSDWMRARDIWYFRLRMRAAFDSDSNPHIP